MDTELQIALITLGFNAFIFIGTKFLNKSKEKSELKGTRSDSINTDSRSMQNFIDTIEDIQALYEKERLKNVERDGVLDTLTKSAKTLTGQNKKFVEDAKKIKLDIDVLTEENLTLKQLVLAGQLDKQRLTEGIRKLIEQMVTAGIQPAFTLD